MVKKTFAHIGNNGLLGTTSPTAYRAERRGGRVINPATLKYSEWFLRNLLINAFGLDSSLTGMLRAAFCCGPRTARGGTASTAKQACSYEARSLRLA